LNLTNRDATGQNSNGRTAGIFRANGWAEREWRAFLSLLTIYPAGNPLKFRVPTDAEFVTPVNDRGRWKEQKWLPS
jgi:hypothetical protein